MSHFEPFIESLARLFKDQKITAKYLYSLLKNNKITEKEYKYITGKE